MIKYILFGILMGIGIYTTIKVTLEVIFGGKKEI